jgi:hypothetical protein
VKRLLIASVLVAGAFAAPAYAAPAGTCNGIAKVACVKGECVPDNPCSLELCVVYVKPDCL